MAAYLKLYRLKKVVRGSNKDGIESNKKEIE